MNTLHEQAKVKLASYRLEAEVQRQLPELAWRTKLAHLLRSVAERLEPSPTAAVS